MNLYTLSSIPSNELLKHDKSIIPSLNTCWEELDRIFTAGFMVLEDRSNLKNS